MPSVKNDNKRGAADDATAQQQSSATRVADTSRPTVEKLDLLSSPSEKKEKSGSKHHRRHSSSHSESKVKGKTRTSHNQPSKKFSKSGKNVIEELIEDLEEASSSASEESSDASASSKEPGSSKPDPDVRVVMTPSLEAWAKKGARLIRETVIEAIRRRGLAVLGLSGDPALRNIYEVLATLKGIDWSKVYIFALDALLEESRIRDESGTESTKLRNLFEPTLKDHFLEKIRSSPSVAAAASADSNTRKPKQVVLPDTSLPSVSECLKELRVRLLSQVFEKSRPDLVVLRMGEDGSMGNLVPELDEAAFGNDLVYAAGRERISATLSILVQARSQLLVVKDSPTTRKKNKWMDVLVKLNALPRPGGGSSPLTKGLKASAIGATPKEMIQKCPALAVLLRKNATLLTVNQNNAEVAPAKTEGRKASVSSASSEASTESSS